MSVVIATAYMDEAQKWDWIVAMDAGKVLATGSPAELLQRTGTQDLEHCFIALLPEEKRRGHKELTIPPRAAGQGRDCHRRQGPDPHLRGLHRRGPRDLVHRAWRDLRLPRLQRLRQVHHHEDADRAAAATEGTATLFGSSVEAGSIEVRKNLGYMTQSFSLYGEMSVRQNLVLHTRLYHLAPDKAKARVEELVSRFGLATISTRSPGTCRWGSGSASRWPWPSCTNRRSSSWTSRRRASIRSPATASGSCWSTCRATRTSRSS